MSRAALAFLLGVLILPVALLIGAWLGWLPTRATARPSALEAALAGHALEGSLARGALGLHNPLAADDTTLLAGMHLYLDGCEGCHGRPGHPSVWGTTCFYPRVPQFAEHAPQLSSEQMFVAIRDGIRYSGMGASGGLVADRRLWQVATFLHQLNSLPAGVDSLWRHPRPSGG